MRIEHLYYLVEIAKTKSITLSAEHLFISQQGLSQAIQKLEADLNVALFRRSRQGVSLTEAGNLAVEKAKEVILKYEELLECMEPYSEIDRPTSSDKLCISTTPHMSHYLPPILDSFREKHPEVNLHIEEQKPDDIVTKLNEGLIDLGLVNLPAYYSHPLLNNNHVHFEKFRSHEFSACVAKSSPLAKKIVFKKTEIRKYPIVVYNLEPYLEMLSRMFGDLSKLDIIAKTNSREIYLKTIIHSKAIGITTLSDVNLFRENSIVAIPIKDSLCLDFGWLVSTQQPLSSISQDLLGIYKNYMTSNLSF
ncbi:LysR family transcriptional regulator [Desulfosporosinus meridiei]|uniref:Transcriptional regulator n=1 Tax=Desulfosporosinus meridiei (strain ATCC BAA-275 / DSM 13257 / KCTC 12902 / NCIMB 13706 / S10) TaxID=768704 RepID=J7INA1_DESMD|nr:LysR family transcriptional regulator [Desulfosporosinus meridiei]AFQ43277.1 transcriptional regulator [Desulfosporosinus meridiei DSM 13257]